MPFSDLFFGEIRVRLEHLNRLRREDCSSETDARRDDHLAEKPYGSTLVDDLLPIFQLNLITIRSDARRQMIELPGLRTFLSHQPASDDDNDETKKENQIANHSFFIGFSLSSLLRFYFSLSLSLLDGPTIGRKFISRGTALTDKYVSIFDERRKSYSARSQKR